MTSASCQEASGLALTITPPKPGLHCHPGQLCQQSLGPTATCPDSCEDMRSPSLPLRTSLPGSQSLMLGRLREGSRLGLWLLPKVSPKTNKVNDECLKQKWMWPWVLGKPPHPLSHPRSFLSTGHPKSPAVWGFLGTGTAPPLGHLQH